MSGGTQGLGNFSQVKKKKVLIHIWTPKPYGEQYSVENKIEILSVNFCYITNSTRA